MTVRLLIPALLLALTGCGNEAKPTGGSADGEILPGSASDAMLPLDTVRSQPPLAPKASASSSDGDDKPEPKQAAPKAEQPSVAATPDAPEPAAPSEE